MKVYNLKLIILISFSIGLVTLSLSHLVTSAAAQSLNLSVSPPLLQVTIKPGKTITQVYKITNQGISGPISVSLVPFEPTDELGNIKLQSTINNQQLTIRQAADQSFLSWFSLSTTKIPGSFKLASGETKELTLKIKIPKNAESKDYYASLIFKASPNASMQGSSGSQAAGAVAANILLTVSPSNNIPKLGIIEEFSTPGSKIQSAGRRIRFMIYDSTEAVPLKLKVTNQGPNLFLISGSIRISSWNQAGELLEIPGQFVLSNSTRILFMKNADDQPLKEIVWQSKGLKIGKFTAQVVLNLDNGNDKLEANTSFWIIPWKLLGGILGVFLFLGLIKQLLIRKSS